MDILLDTFIDTLKLFPFLLVTYLFMEYMEHKTEYKTAELIKKSDKHGPFYGSLCGVLPQCGFSVVASNFYAARIISIGTLMAIYLSTSDEMLPILISSSAPVEFIVKIVAYKAVCGMVFGYIINFIWQKYFPKRKIDIEQLCKNENCHCETSIWRPALYHSVKISVFIFAVTLILGYLVSYFNIMILAYYLKMPLVGELVSGLVGFIPNCSASVILTQLYLENYISATALVSGTLVNGGVGLLVLFRVNRHIKENLKIAALLYGCGIIGGMLYNLVGF